MAKTAIIETGAGQIGEPPDLKTDPEGRISATLLSSLSIFLQSLVRSVNRISLGDGSQASRAGNVDAQYRVFTTPSVADTQFSVPHGLRRKPGGYEVVMQDRAGSLYTSNVGGWGPEKVFFKSSVGDMLVTIRLF